MSPLTEHWLGVFLLPVSSVDIFERRSACTCVILAAPAGSGDGKQIAVCILQLNFWAVKDLAFPGLLPLSCLTVSLFTRGLGTRDISLTLEGLENKVSHTGSQTSPNKIPGHCGLGSVSGGQCSVRFVTRHLQERLALSMVSRGAEHWRLGSSNFPESLPSADFHLYPLL